jgi:hypothetical protein
MKHRILSCAVFVVGGCIGDLEDRDGVLNVRIRPFPREANNPLVWVSRAESGEDAGLKDDVEMDVSPDESTDGGKDGTPRRPAESEPDAMPTEPTHLGPDEKNEPPENTRRDAATSSPKPPMCDVVSAFERNCAGTSCHGTAEALTPGRVDLIYQLDADSLTESVYCDGLLIDPANLEESLLLNKLEAKPSCGLKMPPLTEMSKEDKDCIVEWVMSYE